MPLLGPIVVNAAKLSQGPLSKRKGHVSSLEQTADVLLCYPYSTFCAGLHGVVVARSSKPAVATRLITNEN